MRPVSYQNTWAGGGLIGRTGDFVAFDHRASHGLEGLVGAKRGRFAEVRPLGFYIYAAYLLTFREVGILEDKVRLDGLALNALNLVLGTNEEVGISSVSWRELLGEIEEAIQGLADKELPPPPMEVFSACTERSVLFVEEMVTPFEAALFSVELLALADRDELWAERYFDGTLPSPGGDAGRLQAYIDLLFADYPTVQARLGGFSRPPDRLRFQLLLESIQRGVNWEHEVAATLLANRARILRDPAGWSKLKLSEVAGLVDGLYLMSNALLADWLQTGGKRFFLECIPSSILLAADPSRPIVHRLGGNYNKSEFPNLFSKRVGAYVEEAKAQGVDSLFVNNNGRERKTLAAIRKHSERPFKD